MWNAISPQIARKRTLAYRRGIVMVSGGVCLGERTKLNGFAKWQSHHAEVCVRYAGALGDALSSLHRR